MIISKPTIYHGSTRNIPYHEKKLPYYRQDKTKEPLFYFAFKGDDIRLVSEYDKIVVYKCRGMVI